MERFAPSPSAAERLAHVRWRLQALDRAPAGAQGTARLPLALPAIDGHLSGGLKRAALHEVAPAEPTAPARASTAAIAARWAAIAAGPEGRIAWCLDPARRPALFPPGLAAAGLAAGRFLFIEAREADARLMAMEEAAGACAAVVGEMALAGGQWMRASRRLQLVAERTGAFLLWLPMLPLAEPCAAETRWRVAPAVSPPPPVRPLFPGPGGVGLGPPRLQLTLVRARGAAGGRTWIVEMRDGVWADGASPPCAVVSHLAHGPAEAGVEGGRRAAAG
ncbi:hypothetical protein [Thermaurantiacus sp.]